MTVHWTSNLEWIARSSTGNKNIEDVREINSGISLGNNTSNAQAELLGIAENIFGFTFSEPKVEIPDDLISKIETLIAKRENFRAIKEFSQADQIRDELSEMGIELTDSHAGSNWQFKRKNWQNRNPW